MDVGGERGGQYHDAAGFEQAGEFIERVGGFGHVLQHFATKDGIEAGIWRRDSDDVANQVNACGVPAIRLKPSSGALPAAPWYWQKSCDT